MKEPALPQHVIVHGSSETVYDTAYGEQQAKDGVARCVKRGNSNVRAVLAKEHMARHAC
jgi:hypothetical protein